MQNGVWEANTNVELQLRVLADPNVSEVIGSTTLPTILPATLPSTQPAMSTTAPVLTEIIPPGEEFTGLPVAEILPNPNWRRVAQRGPQPEFKVVGEWQIRAVPVQDGDGAWW